MLTKNYSHTCLWTLSLLLTVVVTGCGSSTPVTQYDAEDETLMLQEMQSVQEEEMARHQALLQKSAAARHKAR